MELREAIRRRRSIRQFLAKPVSEEMIEDLIANAKQKLEKKHLDLIVANDITNAKSGFGTDTNKVTLIDRKGNVEKLPLMSKREVADKILDKMVKLI